MSAIIDIYSQNANEIKNFVDKFYNDDINTNNDLKWETVFENPVQASDIISAYIDNNDKFKISMWVCFDDNLFINVTEHNADKIIKYLFERFPY